VSPELLKYVLIGFSVAFIAVVIHELSKTGLKLTRHNPDTPLFKVPSKAERRKELKLNIVFGAAFVLFIMFIERCGG